MIVVDALSKQFGQFQAVDEISFEVQRGEVVGFLGPNGAGKSTTMRMVAGFLAPTAGRSLVCGHDVGEFPILAKQCMGYLPEGAPLYGDMTVEKFLDFVAQARGLSGDDKDQKLAAVIEKLEIGNVLAQHVETLSKGFKRRVGLAQAILHDPQVLILDEPTDGLDPNQKHRVRRLIRDMAADKAIIISTHILEEVDAVCNRAAIIDKGRLIFDDTPKALLKRSPSGAKKLEDVFRELTSGHEG